MNVLVVDDSCSILEMVNAIISVSNDIKIDCCLLPSEAFERCEQRQYDLVLVDHVMPEMDGVQFTKMLRARDCYRTVPIIMVTSDNDRHTRIEAIRAGATDFLNKPFDPTELQARVTNLLELRLSQVTLAQRAECLAHEVELATAHLHLREEEIMWRLARAIEYRDSGTGQHVSRVAQISRLIAIGIGLSPQRCRTIYLAAPLHDIGKIAIADAILDKPGKLTPDEVALMQKHVTIGASILEGSTSDLIIAAELIAQSHHERWDGTGYPKRLARTDIPIEARIVAIADVFDALCSERPYKKAWPIEKAFAEVVACSGTHFDPVCVKAFRAQWPEIRALMGDNLTLDQAVGF